MRVRFVLGVGILLVMARQSGYVFGSEEITWPEAVESLAEMKAKAESCAHALKIYGDEAQIAGGRLDYESARGETNGAIEGLITALVSDGTSKGLPNLQAKLHSAGADLEAFCKRSSNTLPRDTTQRGPAGELLRAGIEPLVDAARSGIAAIYNDHRSDSKEVRQLIRSQLEEAKWSAFDSI